MGGRRGSPPDVPGGFSTRTRASAIRPIISLVAVRAGWGAPGTASSYRQPRQIQPPRPSRSGVSEPAGPAPDRNPQIPSHGRHSEAGREAPGRAALRDTPPGPDIAPSPARPARRRPDRGGAPRRTDTARGPPTPRRSPPEIAAVQPIPNAGPVSGDPDPADPAPPDERRESRITPRRARRDPRPVRRRDPTPSRGSSGAARPVPGSGRNQHPGQLDSELPGLATTGPTTGHRGLEAPEARGNPGASRTGLTGVGTEPRTHVVFDVTGYFVASHGEQRSRLRPAAQPGSHPRQPLRHGPRRHAQRERGPHVPGDRPGRRTGQRHSGGPATARP